MLLWAMVRLNTTGSLPNDFFSSLVKLLWSRLKVRRDWRDPRASLGGVVMPLPRRWSSWRVLRPLNLPPTRLSPSSLKSRSRLIKEFMVGQGCRPLISLEIMDNIDVMFTRIIKINLHHFESNHWEKPEKILSKVLSKNIPMTTIKIIKFIETLCGSTMK